MHTITTKDLTEITQLHKNTVMNYLANYRFNKFRKFKVFGEGAKYILSDEFINLFYNMLWYRNRFEASKKLKEHFKDYKLGLLSYEEYIK
jgi:hypothetical protein